MALLAIEPNLEHRILRLLGAQPHMSAAALRRAASQDGRAFSRAAVYKVLARLLDLGFVVRSGTHYSLSLTWVFDFLTMADRVSKTYFADTYIRTLIPSEGKRLTWRFSNLIRCNEFWNQLLLALLKLTTTPSVFAWVPYPWFVLLRDERETRLQEVFQISGRHFFTTFGPCGSSRRLVEEVYCRRNQIISFARSPFMHLKDTYIDVIGDYILTVTLSPETAKRIHSIFSTPGRQDAAIGQQLAALSQRCSAKVTVECNRRKSAKQRGVFADFFGVT